MVGRVVLCYFVK